MAYSRGNKLDDEISREIIDIATKIVYSDGAENITVRKILSELGATNRVFYNRFQNIEDVLKKVLENSVMKMRECMMKRYDESTDFYEYLMELAVSVLKKTYETKMRFSNYAFNHDSLTDTNRMWWIERMKGILDYGIEKGYIKKMDAKELGYSVWCFCRGFNADAVSRNMTIEEAVRSFKLGFGCFIEGMKNKSRD